MELKTLVVGMFIALSAFSVKAGVGWIYLCSRRPLRRKITVSCAMLAGYAALFALVYWLVVRVNIIANYELFLPLWSGGVALHWITAALLFAWGMFLLQLPRPRAREKHEDDEQNNCGSRSKAWIPLVVPCPVCASVILMSASCLALYFPDEAAYAVAGLFILFVAAAALGGLAASYAGEYPEETLAQAMIMVSLYFIVSALVTPQFAEVSKVYRLAVYSGETKAAGSARSVFCVFAVVVLLFAAGFFYEKRKIKERRRYSS